MNTYLSKSDFKIASSCSKKLVYKKNRYPTNLEGNEYMQMLADGGYLIGKYATLHYPDGIEIPDDLKTDEALKLTQEYLNKNENIVLFEAAIAVNQKLIRIDILEKKGNTLNLIEVKAKSFDSEIGNIDKDLSSYLEDVAFQKLVLEEAFPTHKINFYLFVPDKSKKLLLEHLISWFEVKEPKVEELSNFRKPIINFLFDINSKEHQTLIIHSILTLIDVNEAVSNLSPSVRIISNQLIRILNEGIKPTDYELNKNCFCCEFRTNDNCKNGFKECWGTLADVKPSIADLYHLGTLGGNKNPIANQMIKEGKVSFFDLQPHYFNKANSDELGNRGMRQLIQYENTLNNTEWFSNDMKTELDKWEYPLHFIDFETYTGAMPHHKGMRPYETVAFQWSCHTISSPGATPTHSEWINTENSFPNFRFAESLRKQIGNLGTPLMWATHENTVLRSILNQMEGFNYNNEKLKNWLLGITKDNDRNGRLVDMNAFTFAHYFHPNMKGKTSIKKVLPAIWNNNEYLHQIAWLKEYVATDIGGVIKSPYDSLSNIISELEEKEAIKDGTGAMKAYHDVQFGEASKEAANKETLKKLLLQYCKLDTMAMVIIWKYWSDKLNGRIDK